MYCCDAQVSGVQVSDASCRVDYAQAIESWAKIELLKEKVKARLDSQYGGKLDKLADLIVEVVVEKSKNAGGVEEKNSVLRSSWEDLYA